MTKAEEIIEKYNLAPNSYYNKIDEIWQKQHILEGENLTTFYQKKWELYVDKGWYGFFGLGGPTPLIWFEAIDEFLEHVKTEKPLFKILQIKVKYGGLRMYLKNIGNDLECQVQDLEQAMYDKNLIY